MAAIYLKHPIHGAKVAISEMEAEGDRQNGWEDFDPEQPAEALAEDVPEPINELQPRRRGRPPRGAT